MKDKIVITSNMVEGVSVVEDLISKPKKADRMGLIYGQWGLGKTTFMEWFFANNLCFHVRALEAWGRSVNMMVEDILKVYRVAPRGRLKHDLPELSRTMEKQGHPLFIDEADRVVRKVGLIEFIRDLHDISRVPIILIGGDNIINLLSRRDLGPVMSRITGICEFNSLSGQDIQSIAGDLCELKCDKKVTSFIRTVTLGDFRLLNALLLRAEKLCSLNKTDQISMSIARESSKAMPHPDDAKRVLEGEELFGLKGEPLLAAAG